MIIFIDGLHHRLGENYCIIDTTQDNQISYETISLKDARKRLVKVDPSENNPIKNTQA